MCSPALLNSDDACRLPLRAEKVRQDLDVCSLTWRACPHHVVRVPPTEALRFDRRRFPATWVGLSPSHRAGDEEEEEDCRRPTNRQEPRSSTTNTCSHMHEGCSSLSPRPATLLGSPRWQARSIQVAMDGLCLATCMYRRIVGSSDACAPKLTLRGNKLPKKISCLYLSGLGGVRFLPAYTFQICVCACIQIEQKFRWISSSLHAASHGPWQYPFCHLF